MGGRIIPECAKSSIDVNSAVGWDWFSPDRVVLGHPRPSEPNQPVHVVLIGCRCRAPDFIQQQRINTNNPGALAMSSSTFWSGELIHMPSDLARYFEVLRIRECWMRRQTRLPALLPSFM